MDNGNIACRYPPHTPRLRQRIATERFRPRRLHHPAPKYKGDSRKSLCIGHRLGGIGKVAPLDRLSGRETGGES